jgi:hypothetical protein
MLSAAAQVAVEDPASKPCFMTVWEEIVKVTRHPSHSHARKLKKYR